VLSDQTARLFLAQYRRFTPVHDVLGSAHRMRRIDRMLVMAIDKQNAMTFITS